MLSNPILGTCVRCFRYTKGLLQSCNRTAVRHHISEAVRSTSWDCTVPKVVQVWGLPSGPARKSSLDFIGAPHNFARLLSEGKVGQSRLFSSLASKEPIHVSLRGLPRVSISVQYPLMTLRQRERKHISPFNVWARVLSTNGKWPPSVRSAGHMRGGRG